MYGYYGHQNTEIDLILSDTFSIFGSLDAFGYEEAWHHEGLKVKVDVFSTEVLKEKLTGLL